MNQILDFGVGGNNDNNNNRKEKKATKAKKEKFEYNSGNEGFGGDSGFDGGIKNFGGGNSGSTKSMSDKVIKVFAILMVILAIFLIVSGVTSIMGNKKEEQENKANSNIPTESVKAEIHADLDEISGKITITVESAVEIDSMRYGWDKDADRLVAGEKQTFLEETVVARSGEHVLHVKVTNIKGNVTSEDFTFNSATGMDTTNPTIVLEVTEGSDGNDKKLQVTVTDDTSIAYVTYSWNEEETVTMTPENEGMQEYQFEVDIPRGKNTIVVTAVDGSDSSNAKTTSKSIEAKTKPVITYGFLDNEGAVLKIMCSHENGIKKIYYTLNGQPYQWEAGEGEEAPKYIEFTQASVVGHNVMTIKVTSVDDTEEDFNPEWDYGVVAETPENGGQAQTGTEQQDATNTIATESQGTTGNTVN